MERGCQPRASGRERSVPVAADIFLCFSILIWLGSWVVDGFPMRFGLWFDA